MVMSSSNLTVNLLVFLIEDREVVSNTLRKALFGGGGGHLLWLITADSDNRVSQSHSKPIAANSKREKTTTTQASQSQGLLFSRFLGQTLIALVRSLRSPDVALMLEL